MYIWQKWINFSYNLNAWWFDKIREALAWMTSLNWMKQAKRSVPDSFIQLSRSCFPSTWCDSYFFGIWFSYAIIRELNGIYLLLFQHDCLCVRSNCHVKCLTIFEARICNHSEYNVQYGRSYLIAYFGKIIELDYHFREKSKMAK